MAIRVWRGLPWPGARKDVESSQTPRAWQGLVPSVTTETEHVLSVTAESAKCFAETQLEVTELNI